MLRRLCGEGKEAQTETLNGVTGISNVSRTTPDGLLYTNGDPRPFSNVPADANIDAELTIRPDSQYGEGENNRPVSRASVILHEVLESVNRTEGKGMTYKKAHKLASDQASQITDTNDARYDKTPGKAKRIQ